MNTGDLLIRPAAADDIKRISEIEDRCFPPAEAASIKSFFERFMAFPECFFVAEKNGDVVGHINGCVTNMPKIEDALYHNASLHDPKGAWQTVFGIAVLPEFQHRGIASALMREFEKISRERRRKGIVLTCKDEKIGFYAGLGFELEGVSDSVHGGVKWNDMILRF